LGALLLGGYLVIIVPPLTFKVVGLVLICAGSFWFCRTSHWTHRWSRKYQNILGVAIIIVLCGISIPQFVTQWRIEHPKPKSQPSVPIPKIAPTEGPLSAQILKEFRELGNKQNATAVKPQLSVLANVAVAGINRESGIFWLTHQDVQGMAVSPANLAVFVGVINNTHVATMITSYYAEIKDKQGRWVRLKSLDTKGRSVYWGSSELALPANENQFFDRSIFQHTLRPGDTATGWAFFEYPLALPEILDHSPARVTIEDINGFTASHEVERKEGGQGAAIKTSPPGVDLRPYINVAPPIPAKPPHIPPKTNPQEPVTPKVTPNRVSPRLGEGPDMYQPDVYSPEGFSRMPRAELKMQTDALCAKIRILSKEWRDGWAKNNVDATRDMGSATSREQKEAIELQREANEEHLMNHVASEFRNKYLLDCQSLRMELLRRVGFVTYEAINKATGPGFTEPPLPTTPLLLGISGSTAGPDPFNDVVDYLENLANRLLTRNTYP